MRNKDKNEEEKKIMEELRSLEFVIKKEEREQMNLKKILQLDEQNDENELDGQKEEECVQKMNEGRKDLLYC